MATPPKSIVVESIDDVRRLEAKVIGSALTATRKLRELLEGNDGLEALRRMKFDAIGCDPLDENRELNLIEQVNQSFTYLVSLRAAEQLFRDHPQTGSYRLNFGTQSGSDVESIDGTIAAETFAAVRSGNNGKLRKDIRKVKLTNARHRYVFYAVGRPDGIQTDPDVTLVRIDIAELMSEPRPGTVN